jgi:hypothetical protein
MGNQLIKNAAMEIKREFPNIKLATFSPIPGFVNWIKRSPPQKEWKEGESTSFLSIREKLDNLEKFNSSPIDNSKNGIINAINALKYQIIHQCRHYLLTERRRGLALDHVANFHFKNGASFRNVIWMGNIR